MLYYEILKKRRLDLNLSVQDIAISSHLAPEFIRAIEDNNLDVFAQDLSYVRYFVRAYADVLGVNWQAIQAEVDGNVEVYARAKDQALTQAQRIMAAQMQAAQQSRARAARAAGGKTSRHGNTSKKKKSKSSKGKMSRSARTRQNAHTSTQTRNPYQTGAQSVYQTGTQSVYQTGTQPVYNTGVNPVYQTGTQSVYQTGTQPVYNTGVNPVYQTGTQPIYQTGMQPVYQTGAQPVYQTGALPKSASKSKKKAKEKKRKKRKVSFFKSSANAISRTINWNSRDSMTKFMVLGTICVIVVMVALNYIYDNMSAQRLAEAKEERQQELLKKEEETQRLADQLQSQKEADAKANGTAPVVTASQKETNTFFITNVLGVSGEFVLNVVPDSKLTLTMEQGEEKVFSQQISQDFSKTIKVSKESSYKITCNGYTSADKISINGTQLSLNPSGFTSGYGFINLYVVYSVPDEKDEKEKKEDEQKEQENSSDAAQTPSTDIYGNPIEDSTTDPAASTDIYGNPVTSEPEADLYGNLIDTQTQAADPYGTQSADPFGTTDTIADPFGGSVIDDDGGNLYGNGD